MFKIRNSVIFRVIETHDGYDVYRLYDDTFEIVDSGLPSMEAVQQLMEEEA